MSDEKYIVFKRKEFVELSRELSRNFESISLPDAVVIRIQDIFAAPALHVYANSIAVSMDILKTLHIDQTVINNLRDVADYFHQCAVQAESTDYRKLPD